MKTPVNPKLQNLLRDALRLGTGSGLPDTSAVLQRALGKLPSMKALKTQARKPAAPAMRAAFQPGVVAGVGDFQAGSHDEGALAHDFKLYVPPAAAARQRALPLVVMLHGCTQNPDDFAVGTGMNTLAAEQGWYVLYPAQSAQANPQRCWNWFKHNHQARDRGEPGWIAGLTRSVMAQHRVDERRVFVAGLSAGGAMAAIVAAAYPDLYAAAGVHSGLAQGAATNLHEALSAMQQGAPGTASARAGVPTIVFHGDHDSTVHPSNGAQVVASVLGGTADARTTPGLSPRGRRYTRTVHLQPAGRTQAEHWLVHGAGHAWSGGHPQGSYTDPQGPDASTEMLRFFMEHPRSAS